MAISYGFNRFIYYLFDSNRPIAELEAAIINDDYIPADMTIDDICAKDTMLISWDVQNRTPRMYSKWAAANLNSTRANHNIPVSYMTLASAATSTFFLPLEYKGDILISGENVAASPALFAFLDATDKSKIDPKTIKVVSIGSFNALADLVNEDSGMLDWASRLLTLNAPVKRHTMDYMMHFQLRDPDGSSRFHKYEVNVQPDWDRDFYLETGSREKVLKQKSQEMIYAYQFDINEVLKTIIFDAFDCALQPI
jgi:hypothetical protein